MKGSLSAHLSQNQILLQVFSAGTARSKLDKFSRHLAEDVREDGKQAAECLFRKTMFFLRFLGKKIGKLMAIFLFSK